MKKVLLGVVLVAAVLAPAASASRPHRVKLAVVVLPKSALGAAGRSLAVSPDSGVVSNPVAVGNAVSAHPNTFDRLGRLGGYELRYGDRYSGRPGVTEIWTGVDMPNVGSRRALEKAGYRQCGVMRRHFLVNGRWVDVWMAEIHREDWQRAREATCSAP